MDANPSYLKMFGYEDVSELHGTSLLNQIAPQCRDEVLERVKQRAAGLNAASMYETIGLRKDGSQFPFLVSVNRILLSDGPLTISFFTDITERKQSEELLKASNELLSLFIFHSPIYAYIKEVTPHSSIVLECSDNFVEMIGIPRSEMIGKPMSELFSPEFAAKITADDWAVISKGDVLKVDEELNGKNYTTIKFPIHQGNKTLLAGYTIDITARKQAEESLRKSEERLCLSLEAGKQGMYDFNLQTGAVVVNDQYALMLGYDPKTFVETQASWLERLHPDDKDTITKALSEYIEEKIPEYKVEFRLQTKDNNWKWVLSFGKIVEYDSNGKPLRMLGTHTDITERKQTEEIIFNRQKMESIGVLASGIAHDFNNLLGAMMGNISLAQALLPADHPVAKNIERALVAMERAATLTKQMLAYSGKGIFQILTIDMVAMVKERVGLFEASLPKNVKLRANFSPTPVYVKGDPGQIEQIVINLIINGGDAIGEKQGVVSIEVSSATMSREELTAYGTLTNTTLKEGFYALLQVTDNGSGMSKETQKKIFDPFFTTKFIGRGLGLSAVLGIIRGHEGGIAFESTEGVGTTFRVLLPLASVPVPIEATAHSEKFSQTPEQATVLVIDDEQYVIDMASDILETGNYKAITQIHPVEAVKIYEQQWKTIALVILDLSMPDMSGKEVLMQMRKINPKVKVILSSGYSEEEANRQIGNVKATAFIQKPYRVNTLLSLVRKVLEMK